MKKIVLHNGIRNIIAVIVGVFIFLFNDTITSVLVGLLLNLFIKIPSNSILFQIILRFIITAINVRFLTLVVNRIAVRKKKEHNIPEYILSAIIIVAGAALCITNLYNRVLGIEDIILCVFNTLLGIMLAFDAKEKFDYI